MKTDGDYYDGKSSQRHSVTLCLSGEHLRISGDGIEAAWALHEIRVAAPLGAINSSVYLPDGSKCDFVDGDFARLARQRQSRRGFFHGLHRWENSLKRALVALALTVALVVVFIQYAIPILAEQAAYAIPPHTESTLGKETLRILDRAIFAPTELDPRRKAELNQLFARVVVSLDATERPYRLELRSSPKIGANAFAMPGGSVIMTDELVAMASHDDELAAVLAHEVGHVRHRHAMRQVIQGSAVALVVATLTGDVFSATSMAAALPTMLVDAKFSREMELQADDVALEYLLQRGEGVHRFAAILTRMEEAFVEKYGTETGAKRMTHYFSSHPATKERIERLSQL